MKEMSIELRPRMRIQVFSNFSRRLNSRSSAGIVAAAFVAMMARKESVRMVALGGCPNLSDSAGREILNLLFSQGAILK